MQPEYPDTPTPRKKMKRVEGANKARYLTFSCYKRLPLLDNPDIYDLFAERLGAARERFGLRLIAWVAMPEHAHLLAMPEPPEPSLVQPLWWFKREVGRRVIARWREIDAPILQRITDSRGRCRYWQRGGGYDRVLRTDEALRSAIRYIHENPVRRGLVGRPEEWAWSSARWYRGEREGRVAIDPLL
ncbi:MAG: transposase [Phycisphaerales bacterium]|nr:transposase [Phycisphaerales bacterium]